MYESHSMSRPAPARHPRARVGSDPSWRARWTILLIEDDDEMRKLLKRALTREGYGVVAVEDGLAALDWLGLCLFDGSVVRVPALIVSDVRLPQFSGLELLEGMLCAVPEIPVILITAFPSEDLYRQTFELGAARVLAKPFDFEDLLGSVYTVLGGQAAPATSQLRERIPGWTKGWA